MKLFYSYSHENEKYRKDMERHLSVLRREGKLDDWCDRKIIAGEEIDSEIEANFYDSDIICLLISNEFLSSDACIDELNKAFERKKKDGISVIPIILSYCSWQDTVLKTVKALPKDGKPIKKYRIKEEAWLEVSTEIKVVIEKRSVPEIKLEYRSFLEETELASVLGKEVILSDIYVPMDFKKRDLNEKSKDVNFSDILNGYLENSRNIIISGDQQSGKSGVLKQLFLKLISKYIPIYIDCNKILQSKIKNFVNNNFKKQYNTRRDISFFLAEKILLFDDFHLLKTEDRKKIINTFENDLDFKLIVTVDNIYDLGIKEHLITKIFSHYSIRKMGENLRDDLTCKWMEICGKDYEQDTIYRDELNSRINMVVQKTIVPAYPFFIYTIVASHEMFNPLDSEITSQGHCYQALIYFALRKVGATDVQIDMYINFLSELSSYLYKKNNQILSSEEIEKFLEEYCALYPISIEREALVNNLVNASILRRSTLDEYSFKYKYIYLYFLGKYFTEHMKELEPTIEEIINNLQEPENGYILIFIIHHTKNVKMLEHIELNLLCLFDKYKETTLLENEIDHLNKHAEQLKPLVIDKVTDIEKNRKESLSIKDRVEKDEDAETDDSVEDVLMIDLRKAIKTVEVAGHILKNRSGSLKIVDQMELFEASMGVFLRITNYFLEEFHKNENDFVEYISYLVCKKLESKQNVPTIDKEKVREISSKIYFNINLLTCFATIRRISESICSKELLSVMEKNCDEKNTPISYLIKKQCRMMYRGSINVEDIKKNYGNLPVLAKRLLGNMVIDHCYMHKIKYSDRQKVSHVLGIKEKSIPIAQVSN